MDIRKEPYIEQQTTENALYTKLQRLTLEESQRLSGKVWTDYNAHDPGVTLADIANYALTELDYKLGFPLTDYLTGTDGMFVPERFGLFPPVDAYTTSPVTEDDYRSMLWTNVPGLENVDVYCDPETGGYTIRLFLSPFEEGNGHEVVRQVKETFHRHRNLCEWLEKVEVVQPDKLDFEAELEIEPREDATEVLARIYWCVLRYLSGEVVLLTPDSREAGDVSPEMWLEGSENALRVVLPELKNTEHELYQRLCKVKGVCRFRSCYLTKNGIPQTRISVPCGLHLPRGGKDFERIKLYCGKTEVQIESERFLEQLKGFYLLHEKSVGLSQQSRNSRGGWSIPAGTAHDVFTHAPLAGDFPDCYRLTPELEQPSSFEVYTRLYDWVIRNGLDELKELPRLLSLDRKDEDALQSRRQLELKSGYLDFLDNLYGMESHPAWFLEENAYGETPAGTIHRRAHFLRNVARLKKNRARARNLFVTEGEYSTPTVKEYFCLLLGLNPDDEHTVSNVLPSYNLRLLASQKTEDTVLDMTDRIDSLLIDERMLQPDNVREVKFCMLAREEEDKCKEYARMRATLPFFHENLITGDLFRGGTKLQNYKIVKTDEGMYMLTYRHQESKGWTNLGRDTDPVRLERLANILRRFLRQLNRKSETLYIVEPMLADNTRAFEVILVLPAWTYRFYSPRFRDKCRELLRSLIPAHLSGKVHWMGENEMRQFEMCYRQLMRTFTDSRLGEYRCRLMEAIDELMTKAEETQDLDDTY